MRKPSAAVRLFWVAGRIRPQVSSSLRICSFGTPCSCRPRMRVSLTPATYGFQRFPSCFSFLTGMLKMRQTPEKHSNSGASLVMCRTSRGKPCKIAVGRKPPGFSPSTKYRMACAITLQNASQRCPSGRAYNLMPQQMINLLANAQVVLSN